MRPVRTWLSASATAGSTRSAHGSVPCAACAAASPATVPGTPTARCPSVEDAASRPAYISRHAPLGACSRKSQLVAVPSARRRTRNPPPPRLPASGETAARGERDGDGRVDRVPAPPEHGEPGLARLRVPRDHHPLPGGVVEGVRPDRPARERGGRCPRGRRRNEERCGDNGEDCNRSSHPPSGLWIAAGARARPPPRTKRGQRVAGASPRRLSSGYRLFPSVEKFPAHQPIPWDALSQHPPSHEPLDPHDDGRGRARRPRRADRVPALKLHVCPLGAPLGISPRAARFCRGRRAVRARDGVDGRSVAGAGAGGRYPPAVLPAPRAAPMTGLDWTIVVVVLASTLGLAALFARRASQGTDQFFAGGRAMPWWLAGTSMVATTFAADTPAPRHRSRRRHRHLGQLDLVERGARRHADRVFLRPAVAAERGADGRRVRRGPLPGGAGPLAPRDQGRLLRAVHELRRDRGGWPSRWRRCSRCCSRTSPSSGGRRSRWAGRRSGRRSWSWASSCS